MNSRMATVRSSEASSSSSSEDHSFIIDPSRNRFPFCIVWGPLPLISWFFPFIGHMGIGDSQGRIHDFAGSYYISLDRFMVGRVTKYLPIDPVSLDDGGSNPMPSTSDDKITDAVCQRWDAAIEEADQEYGKTAHNICCNNCHDHTARAMSLAGQPMSMLKAWALVTTKGRWVSPAAWISVHLPFLLIIALILFFSLVKM